jgi:nitrogen regulatory protein PII
MMVKRYQQQADEALSYISLLLRIDKEYDLIFQLQGLVVNALTSALRINPEDKMVQTNLNTQKTKLNEYKQKQRNNDIVCWVSSDAELTSTQSQLAQVNKLLDLYRNKGDLSFAKHQELQAHVHELQQNLSTNTYLYQADLYGEQNNITSYQLYIKQAIQVIKKSNIDTNLKNKKIKELSDRIQDVKSTGRIGDFKNFIKPSETANLENQNREDQNAENLKESNCSE